MILTTQRTIQSSCRHGGNQAQQQKPKIPAGLPGPLPWMASWPQPCACRCTLGERWSDDQQHDQPVSCLHSARIRGGNSNPLLPLAADTQTVTNTLPRGRWGNCPRFGRPSSTWMRLSASFLVTSQVLSLFLMRIATGRKHQIRVHSAHVGHAVVCDGRYSTTSTYQADLKWCPRNFLHRSRLCFTINRRTVDIEQRLPADLMGALHLCIQRQQGENKPLPCSALQPLC